MKYSANIHNIINTRETQLLQFVLNMRIYKLRISEIVQFYYRDTDNTQTYIKAIY